MQNTLNKECRTDCLKQASSICLQFALSLPTSPFPWRFFPLLGKIKIEGRKCSSFRVQRLGVNQEDRRQMRGCKARRLPAPGKGGERIGVTGPGGRGGGGRKGSGLEIDFNNAQNFESSEWCNALT